MEMLQCTICAGKNLKMEMLQCTICTGKYLKDRITALHDLLRIRNLRSIILSKIPQNQMGPDDFVEFGVDLEEIKIQESNLKTLKNHAFKHVRGLKRLDLSENNIKQVEPDAFIEVTGLSYGKKGYTRVRQILCHRSVHLYI
ncbi:unnamed protein product [Timema podura]|uniref:Uncharacterized protein n=1 Tax=Timema podura TaxID=61482 RepID=A0ABN7PJ26_TIMPD|nr:unnamed protein product [Timema podura]